MQSWRKGTQKQYKGHIEKWLCFASERGCDPLQPPLAVVLDFLTKLYNDGLKYSGINTARSALSSCVQLAGHGCVGTHPLVRRFVKAVYQTRPAFPRYQENYNVSKVLEYLKTLWPLEDLSLKLLTFKLVMLVALVTGQRCQSIHLMIINNMQVIDRVYRFLIKDLVKHSKAGKEQPVLVLPPLPSDDELCVSINLSEYLSRTEKFMKLQKLFFSFIRPYGPVSKDSISRWVKLVMDLSGVDTTEFHLHSTRSASTSKAKKGKCSP